MPNWKGLSCFHILHIFKLVYASMKISLNCDNVLCKGYPIKNKVWLSFPYGSCSCFIIGIGIRMETTASMKTTDYVESDRQDYLRIFRRKKKLHYIELWAGFVLHSFDTVNSSIFVIFSHYFLSFVNYYIFFYYSYIITVLIL